MPGSRQRSFELVEKRFLSFREVWAWIAEADNRFPSRLPASAFFARCESVCTECLLAMEALPDCETKIGCGKWLVFN